MLATFDIARDSRSC